jgi:hypothetical protein
MKLKIITLIAITVITVLIMAILPIDNVFRDKSIYVLESLVIVAALWVGSEAISFFGPKSIMGRSLLSLCIGMFFWCLGCLLNVFAIDYPSWGDIGYMLMIPFAGYGLFLLLKNIDFKFSTLNILKLIILPLLVLIPTYILAIHGQLGGDLSLAAKTFNIIYPVGDIVFLSFALLILSMSYGGGLMFKPFMIISLGFVVEAIADFLYSYGLANETYYNGNISDISFSLAFFTIGLGMYYLWKVHQAQAITAPIKY